MKKRTKFIYSTSLVAAFLCINALASGQTIYVPNQSLNRAAANLALDVATVKAARVFSRGQIGFAGYIDKANNSFEALQADTNRKDIFTALLADHETTPEGRAFAACGLSNISKNELVKILGRTGIDEEAQKETVVKTMNGDVLKKESLFDLIRRFRDHKC